MDKLRHPQVIRSWKIQQTQKTKNKGSVPRTTEPRRERPRRLLSPKRS